ncbi:hypothetical protein D9619_002766 [Psilocybe cf. subviscida]|uniref:Uncharacterized protein n=1 Tax=Psilocybe cf. subviscida TaxID=2480587 RepID=A0A8H5EUB5_9AGAR|nr:hypothetical protein D9619_002766 [Psilocybe cf. subviscida]
MKLPASSSIFLATLAISSSSSCLAAPTGDTSTSHAITSSSSTSHLDGASSEGHVQPRSEEYANIEARGGVFEGVKAIASGLPVVGPLLGHLLEVNNPSPQDLAALQAAADEVTRAIGTVGNTLNSTLPAPIGNTAGQVISHAPAPIAGALSDDPNGAAGGASASAAPPSQTASAAAADAPSSAAQPSGSASPSTSPSGPPNTPALPVNV